MSGKQDNETKKKSSDGASINSPHPASSISFSNSLKPEGRLPPHGQKAQLGKHKDCRRKTIALWQINTSRRKEAGRFPRKVRLPPQDYSAILDVCTTIFLSAIAAMLVIRYDGNLPTLAMPALIVVYVVLVFIGGLLIFAADGQGLVYKKKVFISFAHLVGAIKWITLVMWVCVAVLFVGSELFRKVPDGIELKCALKSERGMAEMLVWSGTCKQ